MSETTAAPSAEPTNEAPSAPALDYNTAPSDAELRGESPAEASPTSTQTPAEAPEPKTVPLPALHEERAKRRELAEQVKRLESRFADVQNFLRQQNAPPEPAPPPLDVDPVAHFKAKTEQLERQIAAVQAPIQQQQQEAAFISAYRAAADAFATETPDFTSAYQHFQATLNQEAAALGIPPAVIERQYVATAMAQGRDPAAAIYQAAKARGYANKPTAPQVAPAAAEAIDAMQRGAQAARSAAAAPAPAEANMTAARLAQLDIRDFAKIDDTTWRKMMGG